MNVDHTAKQLELYHTLLREVKGIEGIDQECFVAKDAGPGKRTFFPDLEALAFLVAELYQSHLSAPEKDESYPHGGLLVDQLINRVKSLKNTDATYLLAQQIHLLFNMSLIQKQSNDSEIGQVYAGLIKYGFADHALKLIEKAKLKELPLSSMPSVHRTLVPAWYGNHLFTCLKCQGKTSL